MRKWVIGLAVAITFVILSDPSVRAQKNGKPTAAQPVWVEFIGFDEGDPRAGTERIRGDGNLYPAIINAVGELVLNVDPGPRPRSVSLDFSSVPSEARALPGACSPSCAFQYDGQVLHVGDNEHFGMATNVVDNSGNPVEGGFNNVTVSSWARFNPTFDDPAAPEGLGRNLYFVLRFYPAYENSDYVLVTRINQDTWTVETAPDDMNSANGYEDAARLWRHVRSGPLSKTFSNSPDEGLFRMPFKILVTR